MRKVFLSIMILSKIKYTEYISDDFDLCSLHYDLPISYIIDNNVEAGEDITIITCVEKTSNGNGVAEQNYQLFQKEIDNLAQKRGFKVNYEVIPMQAAFKASTFNYFFKAIAQKLKDGDELYLDLTFGMKPYSISMFIAANYAVKACSDAVIACAFYSQKFTGGTDNGEVNCSKLYDLTALIYLNDFATKVEAGDKILADDMLDVMMPDNGGCE